MIQEKGILFVAYTSQLEYSVQVMYMILEELMGLIRIAFVGEREEVLKKFAELKPIGSYKYVMVKVEQITDWKRA